MQILGLAIGTFVAVLLIAIFFATFFMWLGAKMAGAKNSTFGNSFLAAIGTTFVVWLVSWLVSVFNINVTIGFVAGLILTILVIRGIYEITFGRALVVWIFSLVAEGLAIFVAFLIFGSVILSVFH